MSVANATQAELLQSLHPPQWRNPSPAARYDLLVIGAGPAGHAAAMAGVRAGVRVALVERELLGGDCLNHGCVPSKGLIRSARLLAEMRDAPHFGVPSPTCIAADFEAAMQRVQPPHERVDDFSGVSPHAPYICPA